MSTQSLHRAARLEDAVHALIEPRLIKRGWKPRITGYAGYGTPQWVRVMARVLLSKHPVAVPAHQGNVRGWRSFLSSTLVEAEVTIEAGSHTHTVTTDRGGYIDVKVAADLEVGWQQVTVRSPGAPPVQVPIRVVGPETTFGLISDIDDTVLVTALPRPFLAAWNTFVLHEHARHPVPGMAVLYERLMKAHADGPVIYLSTGPFNVAPTLTRFLNRHMYPAGPLLLTDWGPTPDSWFRSGQVHKRRQLRRLAEEFPGIQWLLIGDDGQHDPQLYTEFARTFPNNVRAVAIRNLSPAEQVLSRGALEPGSVHGPSTGLVPWFEGPNGAELARQLATIGLLDP